mgnify:CR=1 FL=1
MVFRYKNHYYHLFNKIQKKMPAQTNAGILHTNYSPHNAVSAYRPGFFAVNPESFSGSFPVSFTGTRNL